MRLLERVRVDRSRDPLWLDRDCVERSRDASRLDRDCVDRSRDASRLDRDRVERSVRERDERLARSRSVLLRSDRPMRVDDRDRSERAERRVRLERSASAERPIRPVRACALSRSDERALLRSADRRSPLDDARPTVEPRGL